MNFSIKHARVSEEESGKNIQRLQPYLKTLQGVAASGTYDALESSLNLPFDKVLLKSVEQLVLKKTTKKLNYILVVGIGGSNLGTKAFSDALYSSFDVFESQRFPKIFFLDTCTPSYLGHLEYFLKTKIKSSQELLVFAAIKSGTTTESIVNLEYALQILKKKFPKDFLSRLVVTSGEISELYKSAQKLSVDTCPIPANVGGRYSVFSAVGLFPLAALGVPLEKITSSAAAMRDQCLLSDPRKNNALMSASILYTHLKSGRGIHDTFLFAPELESLGKWYRQLLAESLGKENDLDGKKVMTGITPTVSVGTTDLHSMAQLYLGGPDDKITTFVSVKKQETKVIAGKALFSSLVSGLSGKAPGTVVDAILQGVQKAYQKKERPFMSVVLDDISPESIAGWMQWKMMEVMFLGQLMNVNAFDQPEVEVYKTEARKRLSAL